MTARLQCRVVSPGHRPVGTSRRVLEGRPTLLVTLDTGYGTFFGEATPLSPWGNDDFGLADRELSTLSSEEVLAAAALATARHADRPLGDEAWFSGDASPLAAARTVGAPFRSPAAKFCVETLVLSMAASSAKVPLFRLLSDRPVPPRIPTSCVIDGASETALADVRRLERLGVRHFKIKCGRDFEREVDLVRALALLPSAPRLRLDPNRAWDLETAIRFLQSSDRAAIEWVEDPTLNWDEWAEIGQTCGVKIAVDEPLSEIGIENLGRVYSQVAVLKPMALGGFSATIAWKMAAERLGMAAVVSHLFDGPTAMAAYIHLAFVVGQGDLVAPGLGPHEALEGFAALGQKPPSSLHADHLSAPSA